MNSKNSKAKSINAKYNPSEIEVKWQKEWEEFGVYRPDLDKAEKPFYNLMMFPYPSAEGMHVGNMYAFTGADVYGRFKRMQGHDVFEPIGLDGFGIHSENYAIKVGKHPVEQAKISEKNYYKQLHAIGGSFDWSRTVETYKPEYYKWTQWLFIQLFKAGLVYRKKAPVNFCPSCKTVLADEQVDDGKCERCETEIVKKELKQWFFKITKYADRLLDGLSQIDWAEKVKTAQKLWIGKSEGALIRFKIDDLRFKNKDVEVFTTRPDTLFGATFLVLSPDHSFVAQLLKLKAQSSKLKTEIEKYVEEAKRKTERERGGEKEKTGVFTGLYAINPVNQEKIPVWVADYVLMGYGTGAIMAVPAHDQRDFEFAKKFNLPIKQVIESNDVRINKEAFVGEGRIINSGEWNGWETPDSIGKVIDWLEKKGLGKKEANYHLRDWLISRQRYWGPPIPLVFCPACAKASAGEENAGWQPVPENQLPVELPFIKDYKPLGIHSAGSGQAVQAPLASHPEFYKTKCPKCGGEAKRETDVSDTFLDSSWYFLRYVSTDIETTAFDRERVKKWLPVNTYIGGAEHSVLHLLYSRFIAMALHDLGYFSFEEPFTHFRAHGLIVKDGAKMSKSKGNVVIPDAYIKKFGADTLRAYLMFSGPFSQGGDFRDSGIEGMHRFIRRVWALVIGQLGNWEMGKNHNNLITQQPNSPRAMHKTIKKVTGDIENLSYNTAIAGLMEYYNFLSDQKEISKAEVEVFLKLLSPFSPHLTEELWHRLGNKTSIHKSQWPSFDEKYLVANEVVIAVQINGKLRDTLKVQNSKCKVQSEIGQLAQKSAKVKKYLDGRKILKVVYVPGKIINFVVG